MKAVLNVLAVMLLLAASVSAAENPVDQGSVILEGSAYFMMQSGDLYENWDGDALLTIAVTPTVGYFVSPGALIGVGLNFTRYSQGDDGLTLLTIGPTFGYYFNTDVNRVEAKGAFYPYIQGFFLIGTEKDDDWSESITVMQYGGGAGGILMLSDAVGLNFAVRAFGDRLSNGGSISGFNLMAGVGVTSFIY